MRLSIPRLQPFFLWAHSELHKWTRIRFAGPVRISTIFNGKQAADLLGAAGRESFFPTRHASHESCGPISIGDQQVTAEGFVFLRPIPIIYPADPIIFGALILFTANLFVRTRTRTFVPISLRTTQSPPPGGWNFEN